MNRRNISSSERRLAVDLSKEAWELASHTGLICLANRPTSFDKS